MGASDGVSGSGGEGERRRSLLANLPNRPRPRFLSLNFGEIEAFPAFGNRGTKDDDD
jgi:hypothetical protein